MVREYKGSHSGEHGDGLVRSEFHERMFGARLRARLRGGQGQLRSAGPVQSGQDRAPAAHGRPRPVPLQAGLRVAPIETALDWSAWGGFGGAVEMCNNNGACRKSNAGVMCPSYRVTGDEQPSDPRPRQHPAPRADRPARPRRAHLGRRCTTTMELCVGCKGCKRECPTGVDMARMKIEFLHHYRNTHSLSLRDRLIAWLPRYAPAAARFGFLLNLRNRLPGLAWLSEKLIGFSARRNLPRWRSDCFDERRDAPAQADSTGREVLLWVDTFNRLFRTAERARGDRGARGGRLPRDPAAAARRRPSALRRPYLPLRGTARRGESRGAPPARRADAVGRARRAGHRAGALLPADAARRV